MPRTRTRYAVRRSRGFSVLELVIVFVIVALLAMIAIPYFVKRKQEDYHQALTARLAEVQRAQQAYFEANKRFAPDLPTLGLGPAERITVTIGGAGLATGTGWNATASHADHEGARCVIGFGADTVIGRTTTKSGEIKCS